MSGKAIKAIDIFQHKLEKGIFYFEVEDVYWQEYALGYFEQLISEQARDFDLVRLVEPSFDQIAERMSAYPLFGDRQVTIVEHYSERFADSQRAEIAKLSRDLPLGFFLVFASSKGLIAADKALMIPILASKATQYELIRHIKDIYPNTFEDTALRKLIDYTVSDMVRINMEAKKLSDFVGNRKVTSQDVEELVFPDAEYKMYEFTNALSAKSYKQAMDILESLLLSGLAFSALFRSLITNYQRMFYAKTSPLSPEELGIKLRVKPYAVMKNKEASARYSPLQLMNILTMLKEKEWEARSGKMSEKQAFQAAIALLTAY